MMVPRALIVVLVVARLLVAEHVAHGCLLLLVPSVVCPSRVPTTNLTALRVWSFQKFHHGVACLVVDEESVVFVRVLVDLASGLSLHNFALWSVLWLRPAQLLVASQASLTAHNFFYLRETRVSILFMLAFLGQSETTFALNSSRSGLCPWLSLGGGHSLFVLLLDDLGFVEKHGWERVATWALVANQFLTRALSRRY